MMINCGHCGGAHATVADVRACSGAAAGSTPSRHPTAPTTSLQPQTAPDATPLPVDWSRLAGPPELARNLIVGPTDPVPAPWADAPIIELNADAPDDALLDKLVDHRIDRRPVVVRLTGELPDPDPMLPVEYWHLAPDTDLPGDRLRHVVMSHAVDARVTDRPTIAAVDLALAVGATLADSGPGDVVGPDGPVWCDGGPLHWFNPIDGASVVPAPNLRCGSLTPLQCTGPSADLAPDQLAAVGHSGAGARIIAPAGSGKTRVLTERARHLIRDRHVDPRCICLLAFNVRAREEMQERTTDLPGLEIRTLNSLALAIVAGRAPFRRPTVRRGSEVIDERQVRRILDDLVPGRRQAMADPMAVWIEALTATRLGLRDPAHVETEFAGDIRDFLSISREYRDRLARAGALDFDEQILGAIEVLLTDPGARRAARRACQLMLVDEFQDLTPAHVLLVRLLAGPEANVFGVGDDDQTIYGYAGASPAWLIDFANLFPGSAAHDLHVNYRCAPPVVDGASTLLQHNRRRIAKTMRAKPGRDVDGLALEHRTSPDPSSVTVEHVLELINEGVSPSDIAILTRVNATLLGPMLGLDAAGVATTAPIDANFVERTGVAGALAWLRLGTAPSRALPGTALETAIRRPPRGLRRNITSWVGEKQSIREIVDLASRLNEARDQNKVADFAADLQRIRDLADEADTETLLVAIRDEVGLGRALDKRLDASRRSVDRSAHGDDLAALLAVARHQPDPEAFPDWLAERLSVATPDWSGVRLSTIHRVKGREWPHVVVHEATAGLMPHRLSSDVEEERRVFHVAITRSSARTLVVSGTPTSPFVAQMTEPPDPNAPAPTRPVRVPSKSARDVPEANSIEEAQIRERLRTWRTETSKAAGMPAYVVFNDVTLYAIADRRPLSDDELLDIPGIGPVKVERYGEAVIEIITGVLDV